MKAKPGPDPADYHEGQPAARRFDELFGPVLATPRDVLAKRLAAYERRKKQRQRRK